MQRRILQKILLSGLFGLVTHASAAQIGQRSIVDIIKKVFEADSVRAWASCIHTDSVQLWTYPNRQTKLFRLKDSTEIWSKELNASKLNINHETELLTLEGEIKIWRRDNWIKVWSFDAEQNDWAVAQEPQYWPLNDSTRFWSLNEQFKLFDENGASSIWRSINNVKFFEIDPEITQGVWTLDDTTQLWPVNDSLKIWISKDSAMLWSIKQQISPWEISQDHKVWLVNDTCQISLSNNKHTVWLKNQKTKNLYAANTLLNIRNYEKDLNVFALPNKDQVVMSADTVLLWGTNIKERFWSVTPQIKAWTFDRPKPKEPEPVDTVPAPKPQLPKYASLHQYNDSVRIWNLADSSWVWQVNDSLNHWTPCNYAQVWAINDSTKVWTLTEQVKVLVMNQNLQAWNMGQHGEWMRLDSVPEIKLDNRTSVHFVNDTVRFVISDTSTVIWLSNNYIKQWKRWDSSNSEVLNDSTTLWPITPQQLLWTMKDSAMLWKATTPLSSWSLEDSTKIVDLGDKKRITILPDTIKIWSKGKQAGQWIPYQPSSSESDNITMWNLSNKLKIIKQGDEIRFWKVDDKSTVYHLNENLKIWHYTPVDRISDQQKKKLSNWKLGGEGNLQVSQGYQDNWVSGGVNSFSSLWKLEIRANWAKGKNTWENTIKTKLGVIQPHDVEELRKNEDQTELSSKFGREAIRKVYYSFLASGKSQLFNGFKYTGKTQAQRVSAFLTPATFVFAAGIDLKPAKTISILLSPITFKLTYVNDMLFRSSYGVRKGHEETEPGAYLKSNAEFNLTREILFKYKLDVFTNYKDKLQVFDIDFQPDLVLTVNKYINAGVGVHLKYDQDENIPRFDKDGAKLDPIRGKVQFKELLTIGFSYKF